MGYVCHLNALLVAVVSELGLTGQILAIGVADDGSERGKFAGRDIGGDGVSEVVYGGKIGEVKLVDRSFSMRGLGKCAAELRCVDIIL